jgi:hypothetical protein
MVYLQILCHLILIFAVFEPWKINYARGLINYPSKPSALSRTLFHRISKQWTKNSNLIPDKLSPVDRLLSTVSCRPSPVSCRPSPHLREDFCCLQEIYWFTEDLRRRQRSEQYLTSCQQFCHFLRQVKDKPQTGQILLGRSDFDIWRAMIKIKKSKTAPYLWV